LTIAHRLDQLDCINGFAQLPEAFYTRLAPRPVSNPWLVHANPDVARLIGLDPAVLQTDAFLQVFAGNQPLPGGEPLAAVYSGHQFGVWAGQLGDGRAHLLAEVAGPHGNFELQLKGSGLTPYSRMGDGRAVLRSSVREYLVSAAMHGLGIPTTHALALVGADDPVRRERIETAAVVTRVATSSVRFGSFEHWSSSPENLGALLDYVVDRHYPECRDAVDGAPATQARVALRFLRAVTVRTARLLADWQTAGFCHGVMNTDNMSILGLTLDYGPYGFMDAFQVDHVCNHSDSQGRYAWNAQPSVATWSLYRLASALLGLGVEADALKEQLQEFEPAFLQAYRDNLCRKLGLLAWTDGDDDLLDDWWRLLHTQKADFTLSFRSLARAPLDSVQFFQRFHDRDAAGAWLDRYVQRLAQEQRPDPERIEQMNRSNPLYVLRNHLAEGAIRAAAQGDVGEIDTLLKLLRDPYTEQPGHEAYAAVPPEWAGRLEVSCSS